jgi:hypothetical protein
MNGSSMLIYNAVLPPSKKKILTFAFRQGFGGPDGLKHVAKNASIPGPLVVIRSGRFLSYFGNQGNILVYFPQEPNPTFLRAFLELTVT